MMMRGWGWEDEDEDERMRMRGLGWEDEDERMRMRGWGGEDADERMRMRGWEDEDERVRMRGWGWEDEDEKCVLYNLMLMQDVYPAFQVEDGYCSWSEWPVKLPPLYPTPTLGKLGPSPQPTAWRIFLDSW